MNVKLCASWATCLFKILSLLVVFLVLAMVVDRMDIITKKKAIELYERAAKRGDAGAQYNLGNYYSQGTYGLSQSSKRAFEYFTLAAEQGDAEAQNNVGCFYANGAGIETSYSKAREWCTLICYKKWKTIKNDTKKRRKKLKLNGYVLLRMLVTPDTAHFETSLLNADA